jgi:hypothetical protein
MKVRFTCPVHGIFEVGCDEVVIDVFDVHFRCGSGCVITKKVNPVVARRLRGNGAQEVAAALALEASDYLDGVEQSAWADHGGGALATARCRFRTDRGRLPDRAGVGQAALAPASPSLPTPGLVTRRAGPAERVLRLLRRAPGPRRHVG